MLLISGEQRVESPRCRRGREPHHDAGIAPRLACVHHPRDVAIVVYSRASTTASARKCSACSRSMSSDSSMCFGGGVTNRNGLQRLRNTSHTAYTPLQVRRVVTQWDSRARASRSFRRIRRSPVQNVPPIRRLHSCWAHIFSGSVCDIEALILACAAASRGP